MREETPDEVMEWVERLMDLCIVAEACFDFVSVAQRDPGAHDELSLLVGALFDASAVYCAKYDLPCLGNSEEEEV